jgi:sporulation protein YlmC with PRC-barrel domain
MNIALDVNVYANESKFGKITQVVIDPQAARIQYIVVKADDAPHEEYLVPLEKVAESDSEKTVLNASKGEVMSMQTFVDREFVEVERDYVEPIGIYTGSSNMLSQPFVVQSKETYQVTEENIPRDDLTIRRGDDVHAANGDRLGKVDEFIIDDVGHITHIVMREDHLLRAEKEYAIPTNMVERVQNGNVNLTVSKDEVEALPVVAVHRWWS